MSSLRNAISVVLWAQENRAQRSNATLAVIDKAGYGLAPLVRRTWAPRGRTPIIRQPGRAREKVSANAAVTVTPRRRRVGLSFALYPDQNIHRPHLVVFLRHRRRMLQRDTLVV